MRRQESVEDYLETILVLNNRLGIVRSIDIVHEMGFSKPSVSIAMKKLREKEFITMDINGYIILTPEGEKIAESVYDRHVTLTEVLVHLGVPRDVAKEDACRIEHDLSKVSFQKIKAYFQDLKQL
ncbi:MAG: metal-dependent transcriptional regulator [Bacillota bacterium]|nr:metal-dependent transcriptional regulator [Bacillota bacterium]